MTELSMWVSWKLFSEFNHTLYRCVCSISSSMVYVHTFQLYVKWTNVLSIEPNNIFTNTINFRYLLNWWRLFY